MSKHTPGPWTIGATDLPRTFSDGWIDSGGFRIDANGIEQLCYVWNASNRLPPDGSPQETGPRFGDDRSDANARLIAAAPDLLEALKLILPYAEDHCDSGPDGSTWKSGKQLTAIAAADAAIAKATGEQP